MTERDITRARSGRLRGAFEELAADDSDANADARSSGSAACGPTPLATCQSWFFNSGHFDDLNRWNMAGLTRLRAQLDPLLLERTVRVLLERHDVLRARFSRRGSEWHQEIPPATAIDIARSLAFVQRPERREPERAAAIRAEAERAQAEMRLEQGELVKFVYFDFGADEPAYLLFVVHHVVIDATSHLALFEDFETSYRKALRGEKLSLKPAGTPFRTWMLTFEIHARAVIEREKALWLELARIAIPALPLDFPVSLAANVEGSTRYLRRVWSGDELKSLRERLRPGPLATLPQALLHALVCALFTWTAASRLSIKIMNSGRFLLDKASRYDVTRTVGPFAFAGLAVFRSFAGSTARERALDFNRQLECIPDHGVGAEIIAQFSPDPDVRKAVRRLLAQNQILFNYFVTSELATSELADSVAVYREATRHHDDRRPDVLEWTFAESSAGLALELGFSCNLHREATLERLLATFEANLLGAHE